MEKRVQLLLIKVLSLLTWCGQNSYGPVVAGAASRLKGL